MRPFLLSLAIAVCPLVKLEISVTSGNGAVVPFIVTTDNGSGDTHIRLQ